MLARRERNPRLLLLDRFQIEGRLLLLAMEAAALILSSMGTSARWSATLRRCLVAIGQLDRVSRLGEESDLTTDSCCLGRREEASSSSLRCHAWRSGGCRLRSCFSQRTSMRRMPSPGWHRAEAEIILMLNSYLDFSFLNIRNAE